MSQVTLTEAMHLAVQHHQAGRLAEAETIYRQVLAAEPEFPDAMYLLGAVAQQVGRHDIAVDLMTRAIERNGQVANWRASLGVSLAFTGKLDAAMDEFTRAITLQPTLADAHLNLGNTLNLKGLRERAIKCFRKAIELKPDYAEAHFNLANALRETAVDEAIEEYRKVSRLRPDLPVVHVQLGEALHQRRRLEEAIESYRRAIRLQPDQTDSHYNLGVVLGETGRREEAIAEYRAAIELNPDFAPAHFNLAVALGETAPIEQVLHEFREVLRIDPNNRVAFDNVLHLQHYLPETRAKALFEEHREWARRFEQPVLAQATPPAVNHFDPDRRLRIGYVSRDFRTHSVSFFFEPVLQSHDRMNFEVFCYADEIASDATTQRLRGLADVWRDVTRLSDEQLADQVRADQIDVLIDLAGHTEGNRLMTFARRAAPVQMTWLGYPNTTGMSAIDYRITDAHADPHGTADALATEKLLRLPSGWCYRPPTDAPPTEAIGDGSVTFGCFNALAKINRPLVAMWSAVLKEVGESRMLLKSRGLDRAEVAARIYDLFEEQGIEPRRIELLGASPSLREHLATYGRIDVALDTFPYHGTTTTCEALWMGVPVVTLAGHTHASRVGVSLLNSAGLGDLVAHNRSEFVSVAARAAGEGRDDNQRVALRGRLSHSGLTDAAVMVRELERALRAVIKRS